MKKNSFDFFVFNLGKLKCCNIEYDYLQKVYSRGLSGRGNVLTFHKVETEEDLGQVYRLRYQIYCLEKGFEPEEKYPDGIEMDEYDVYSIHFIAKVFDVAVGTARLILNNPLGFPAENYCKADITDFSIKKEQTVEISRFAVSNALVRAFNFDRTRILIGLFREVYQETKQLGIEYLCAAMGKGLQRLLCKYGVIFSPLGPVIDYHGPRAFHLSSMVSMEEDVFLKDCDLFKFISSPVHHDPHELITHYSPV
jgi:N-acyl-L-homoserine lactone synthetase